MTKISFSELIQAIMTFIDKAVKWIDVNIISNIGAIVKFIGNLIIKLLLLAVDLVKWIINLF